MTSRRFMLVFLVCLQVLHVRGSRCRVPEPPEHGFLDQQPRGSLIPGDVLTYTCEHSHYIDLYESPDYDYQYEDDYDDFVWRVTRYARTCLGTGLFDGLSVPECTLFTCEQEEPTHGYIEPNGTEFRDGESAKLHCPVGYAAVGRTTRTCLLSDDGWNQPNAHCERIYCPKPVLKHGDREPASNVFYAGDTVRLACDQGYELKGPDSLECTFHYGWNSSEIPVCHHKFTEHPEFGCLDPGTSPGAILELEEPMRRRYACDAGMMMHGDKEITCNGTSATWSRGPPFCRTRHCFDTIPEMAYRIKRRLKRLTTNDDEDEVDEEDGNVLGPQQRRKKRALLDITVMGEKPLTLYLVVDQSGSIPEKYIDFIKLFMKELINRLKVRQLTTDGMQKIGGVRIGLVGFASKAKTHFLPYQDIAGNATAMNAIITNDITPMANSTNIQAGLQNVIDAIKGGEHLSKDYLYWNIHNKNCNKGVILITDGIHNGGGDPTAAAEIIREQLKYSMYVIGVADTTDDKQFLKFVDGKKKGDDIYHLRNHTSYKHLVDFMLTEQINYTECGVSPVKDCNGQQQHIVGGNITTAENFPWSVKIYTGIPRQNIQKYIEKNKRISMPVSGHGSVIGKKWVLTAAHNFYVTNTTTQKRSPRSLDGVLLEFGNGKLRTVKAVYDPGYKMFENTGVAENDVMIVEFDEELTFSKTTLPVCLPKRIAGLQTFEPDESDAYAIGEYGYLVATSANSLESVCTPTSSCEFDKKTHHRITNGTQDIFCAGSRAGSRAGIQDTNKGDSGSTFVRQLPSINESAHARYVALGVTSFNANPENPRVVVGVGAYVNVSWHMDWIETIIRDRLVDEGSHPTTNSSG